MRTLENKLKNRKLDYSKLIEYGFINEDDKYIYKTKIYNNQFEIIVEVKKDKMTSKLIDLASNEEYVLVDIQDSIGEFVGKVREEYENVLKNIIEKCSILNIFKSKQSKEVIEYIKSKYGDNLEYLWDKFPEDAIWRNKINNKWYALIMVVQKDKLGIESEEKIDILDLKYQKNEISNIIDNDRFFEGYHMNKKSWITIKLDESIDINKIYELIDNSYKLSLEK